MVGILNSFDMNRFVSNTGGIVGAHEPFGCVTQELLPVFPQAVSLGPTEDDMQAADYSKFVPLILKELKMLRARVLSLEATLSEND